MGWVDPWVGLGWGNYSENTKNLKGFVLAFWAAAEDILNISLSSLYLNDIMTLLLIHVCAMTVKNMKKYAWELDLKYKISSLYKNTSLLNCKLRC